MNISEETLIFLNNNFNFNFYDNNCNVLQLGDKNITNIHIGFSKCINGYSEYIGKTIKLPTKKEVTVDYIMNKINNDKTFIVFTDKFNKLIKKYNLNAYPTTYGIGIFVGFGKNIKENKTYIENVLNDLNINFTTEYSDANFVFRYKISKSKDNINMINRFINS